MLAQRPPMGWNSWNVNLNENDYPDFGQLTEKAIIEQGQAMVDSGMLAAGYEYLVLDDGFQNARRDYRGRLQGHALRFRNGIPALVEQVHSLGLKFGIYSVPGSLTCAQQYNDYVADGLGSIDKEKIDADAFAEWGVDYLKYDWCRAHLNDGILALESFTKMSEALKASGRDIVFSISEYGLFKPHEWAPEITNLWRTTDDLFARWDSILRTIELQVGLHPYSKPGSWNDPDMLQIGNHGLTSSENRAHFFMWAILNAPLMAGTDLTRMSDEVRDLLIHPGVIDVDQDWGGSQGQRVSFTETSDIWSKPMSDGGAAAVLLNKSDAPARFELAPHFESFDTAVDVFTGSALSVGDKIEVAPRDAVLIRFN